MATSDDTRAQTPLELAIDVERRRLLSAHAVQKCLCEVLLYADGEDAATYAEAAQLVATLIEESVENLDLVNLRRLKPEWTKRCDGQTEK